jgi:hypothetical protein
MEATSGRNMNQEIGADHAIHPIKANQWKRQLLDSANACLPGPTEQGLGSRPGQGG